MTRQSITKQSYFVWASFIYTKNYDDVFVDVDDNDDNDDNCDENVYYAEDDNNDQEDYKHDHDDSFNDNLMIKIMNLSCQAGVQKI